MFLMVEFWISVTRNISHLCNHFCLNLTFNVYTIIYILPLFPSTSHFNLGRCNARNTIRNNICWKLLSVLAWILLWTWTPWNFQPFEDKLIVVISCQTWYYIIAVISNRKIKILILSPFQTWYYINPVIFNCNIFSI